MSFAFNVKNIICPLRLKVTCAFIIFLFCHAPKANAGHSESGHDFEDFSSLKDLLVSEGSVSGIRFKKLSQLFSSNESLPNCVFKPSLNVDLCLQERKKDLKIHVNSPQNVNLAIISIGCKEGKVKGRRRAGYVSEMKTWITSSINEFCPSSSSSKNGDLNLVFEFTDKTNKGTPVNCGDQNFNINGMPLITCTKKDSEFNYIVTLLNQESKETLIQYSGNCNDPKVPNIDFNRKYLNEDSSEFIAVQLIPKVIRRLCITNRLAYSHYSLGYIKAKQGDKSGAITDYSKAIEAFPKYAKAYNNRALLKEDLGDRKGALKDYNEAIKFDPSYYNAYLNRGKINSKMGNKKKAILDYSKIIEMNPKIPAVLLKLGIEKIKLGKFEEALDHNTKAIELKTDYAAAYRNRGIARINLNDFKGACKDISKSLSLGDVKTAELLKKLNTNNIVCENTPHVSQDKVKSVPLTEAKPTSPASCKSNSFVIADDKKICLD